MGHCFAGTCVIVAVSAALPGVLTGRTLACMDLIPQKTYVFVECMSSVIQGGDLRQALTEAPAELHWYNKGAPVVLDIIKGLHFLHKHMV